MSGCIREEDNNGGNYSYCIGSHRLSSGINARFAQWFSLHTHPTTAIVKITSLNSHFPHLKPQHKIWESVNASQV